MGKYGKKNKVSLNPLDANICLLGTEKVGKTSLMKQMAEKQVGEDGYLFLEMFRENGAKYIEGINYENVPNWETFIDIIDDIVENKTTDYPELKIVVIDTIDNALQLAEQESIRLHNKENPTKRTTSINQAWGGFMKGQDKALDLLQEQYFRLRNVGIAPQWIGHIKQTNITDAVTGETYQQLSSDVTQRYFNGIKKNIDLIAIAYVDREIVKEKTGKKNIVTKKEEVVNKVKSEARRIKFRDENYTVDSGSRFRFIEPEIEFNADEFIRAMKDALVKEIEYNGVLVEERLKEDRARAKKLEKEVAQKEKENKSHKEIEEMVKKILDYCTENKSDINKVKPIITKCKELGYGNPKDIDDIEVAREVLELVKE